MPVRYIGFIDLGFMTYKFKEKCLRKVVMILVKGFLLKIIYKKSDNNT